MTVAPSVGFAQLALVVVTAAVAFGLSTFLIPPLIRLAVRRSWLDVPTEARRVHKVPVPRLGGVAVVAAAGLTFAVTWFTVGPDTVIFRDAGLLPGLIIALSVVFITGLVDDLTDLSPRVKFGAQVIAAGVLVAAGFRIEAIALAAGMPALSLGWLSVPITMLWLVGITNAFNLIDGIDGLAGTVAVLALVVTIVADVLTHGWFPPLLSIALIGAVAGFLRHNLSPASIFLGDAGAMTLGLFIAARVTMASTSADGATYVVLPLFVLVLPLLDTGLAMGRRWLRGDPVSAADGRHIHHQLLALGLTTHQTVRVLGAAMLAFSLVGLVVVFAPPQLALALLVSTGILLCIGLLYLIRWLGYAEFGELGSSVAAGVRDVRSIIRDRILANEVAARIRTANTLEEVTGALEKLTDEVRLLDVQILEGDVHLHGPQRQQISPVDKLPVRLDYPCAWESNGKVQEVILRLWSTRPSPSGAHAIERIACRVGPALEEWLRTHAESAATAALSPRASRSERT
ncbi:MraY family glycosyltransferase [Pseudogemmatithrix spongiicola]|uniref:MraY family glycosyltransferase n=1 Tax=Pseudogemmatithrix spongiicola TaxID=3062599 RepID=A0AA49JV52_9BACT|nr:MraY family glycosyltransferase [Gemmatimonadaceae bacterium 'strain 138']WKW15392.1 MraY family glycosyltransferase [Gemmatimonadaceae bacterium 'strain 318']